MKILFVTNGLSSGGSERVLSTLANKLSTHNYSVCIVCVRGKESFYPIDNKIKVFFLDKEKYIYHLWQKMLWLRSFTKKMDFDLVISFIVRVYGFTILSLMGCHIPIITSERNDPRSFDYLSRWIMHIFLPFSDHHVVQTENIKTYYPAFIQKKTSVISNPVNPSVLSQPPVEKKDVIISVGRLVRQKNHQMLINGFAAIADRHPSYKLVIYGEGPLREYLQQHIKRLGMEKRIMLPGRTKDIIKKMCEARIFCMTSTHEGMSNALIEALCLKLPVITTNVSGVEKLITHNQNGLLIPVNNVPSLSKALDRLIDDEDLQRLFNKNNCKKISMFDINTIITQWETIIQNIMRKNQR